MAGPSGALRDVVRSSVDVEMMQGNDEGNLPMLAVAADFMEDADAAVEYLADGRIRTVRKPAS